jgi:hypothetical protein
MTTLALLNPKSQAIYSCLPPIVVESASAVVTRVTLDDFTEIPDTPYFEGSEEVQIQGLLDHQVHLSV